jgi:type IV fimbrial biogenesis protein FimT
MLATISYPGWRRRQRGVSLIELLVGLAILGLLMALTVPSMKSFISKHKVSAINSELVADFYLARSEAVQRNQPVGVIFNQNSTMTCYTIYATEPISGNCDCTLPLGRACGAGATLLAIELKTVRILNTTGVTITSSLPPVRDNLNHVVYTGIFTFQPPLGIPSTDTPEGFKILVGSVDGGQLQTTSGMNGRQSVCTPDGSMTGVPRC